MKIRTRSRAAGGFRRAGVRHTPEPQVFEGARFSAAEIEQLLTDAELVVDVLEDDGTPSGAPAEDAAAPARTRAKK